MPRGAHVTARTLVRSKPHAGSVICFLGIWLPWLFLIGYSLVMVSVAANQVEKEDAAVRSFDEQIERVDMDLAGETDQRIIESLTKIKAELEARKASLEASRPSRLSYAALLLAIPGFYLCVLVSVLSFFGWTLAITFRKAYR